MHAEYEAQRAYERVRNDLKIQGRSAKFHPAFVLRHPEGGKQLRRIVSLPHTVVIRRIIVRTNGFTSNTWIID